MNNHIAEYKYQKAKYNIIELYYMEDTTPDELSKYVYEPDC